MKTTKKDIEQMTSNKKTGFYMGFKEPVDWRKEPMGLLIQETLVKYEKELGLKK